MNEQNIKEEKCCVVTCDILLGETYWNNQYEAHCTELFINLQKKQHDKHHG